jgi:hypothetical protein
MIFNRHHPLKALLIAAEFIMVYQQGSFSSGGSPIPLHFFGCHRTVLSFQNLVVLVSLQCPLL